MDASLWLAWLCGLLLLAIIRLAIRLIRLFAIRAIRLFAIRAIRLFSIRAIRLFSIRAIRLFASSRAQMLDRVRLTINWRLLFTSSAMLVCSKVYLD
jgi:hypothetical protein